MKKLCSILLVVAMVCSLAACGGGKENEATNNAPVQGSAENIVDDANSSADATNTANESVTLSYSTSDGGIACTNFYLSGAVVETFAAAPEHSCIRLLFVDEFNEMEAYLETTKLEGGSYESIYHLSSGDASFNGAATIDGADMTIEMVDSVIDFTYTSLVSVYSEIGDAENFIAEFDFKTLPVVDHPSDEPADDVASSDSDDGSASGTPAGASGTFDTVSYHTYDANGKKVEDVLQIAIDSEQAQVTLFGRYQATLAVTDESYTNDEYMFYLWCVPAIDLTTGEEIVMDLRMDKLHSYNVMVNEFEGKIMEETIFCASYEIMNADYDKLAAGSVYADLSQSDDCAANAEASIASYIGQDGAANVEIYDGGFNIEGVASASIPLYEYYITLKTSAYFPALTPEGTEVIVQLSQGGDYIGDDYVRMMYYTVYSTDFEVLVERQITHIVPEA